MRWCRWKAVFGALVLAALVRTPQTLGAEDRAHIPITVEDAGGAAVAGAAVKDATGKPLGATDESGNLNLACQTPCHIEISAPGFAAQSLSLSVATTLHLQPQTSVEQVTVTAYRTPLGELESPATTRFLSERTLRTTASVTLDGQLRQLPGVETFRRSPSLVANPTSQGVSLRGLGSTSASRTLVTEDDVPLNDPLGGWIHWLEQPELSIRNVELMRGGASDLYGSSAIGGVISVVPVRPESTQTELNSSYGGEGTYDESLLTETKQGPFGLLFAAGMIGTDGYIQEAPFQRGPIDVASNVHGQNGLLMVERARGPLRIFVRGSVLNERRHNGTPYQYNATRVVRYSTGADWNTVHNAALKMRLYGSDERYRQTFSSVSNTSTPGSPGCSYRCSEAPTKFAFVPDNELGAAAHWSQPLDAGLLLVAGADVRDVRVWDREQSFGTSTAITNLDDHQRDSGLYAEAMWTHNAWMLTASGRVDWFENYDGHQVMLTNAGWVPTATQPPQLSQNLFDPRLGVSRKLGNHWAVSASSFRAFRAPTPNELYRATQVGNQLTLANGNLLSERATGWETGIATQRSWGTVRASYFLTQVNRPIVALTKNPTSSPILLMRENLGQIESRGVSLDYELAPRRWMVVDGGYQYAHAVVSRGTQDDGNWIPEVAHNMATLDVRIFQPKLGTLSLQNRISGHMYDDDANVYLLHGYFRVDAYGSHNFGSRFEVFAAGENLLNRAVQVSATPNITLGQPRTARVGFLWRLSDTSN